MRMQHWSKWVMALLVNAACVASAPAQDYPSNVSQAADIYQSSAGEEIPATQSGQPMEAGYYPGYSNEYGAYPVQPWPDISPYDYSFDQTYQGDDGLWYRRTNNRQVEHYFGVEYFNAAIKRPKSGQKSGFVGASTSNTTSVYDWTARELFGQIVHLPQKDINAPFTTEAFGSDENRPGVRARFGAINPDDSGWEVLGFYAGADEQAAAFTQGSLNRSPDQFASNGEGPLEFFTDGMIPPTIVFVQGSMFPDFGRLPFDEGVKMSFNSQAWGGEFNYYSTPIQNDSGTSNIHGSVGVRYMGIWEEFGFEGSDSGYSEIVILPDGRLFQISPYTTTVNSRLQSHLVGPQLGLKWELGGKKLKLVTEVKGSIAANFEENELRYSGYGLEVTQQSDLIPVDPTEGREKVVHVDYAPIFEASFMAEFPIMQYLPVTNKMPGFRDAQFRIGYTFTQAWRIRRPAQSIEYSAPVPYLTTNRDNWHVSGMVAGFTWTYYSGSSLVRIKI